MSDVEEKLKPLRLAVAEQGNLVKKLKEEKANDIDIQRAVTELKTRKRDLDAMVEALIPKEEKIDRGKMEDLLKRRFFYDQSFSIYGGVNGLYDYGPMGCSMKANLINEWRRQFVLEEQMFEVSCSMLTPTCVLEASGHVARFTDFMVKDKKNGECFRADHLIEANLEKLMSDKKATQESKDEMDSYIRQLDNMSADDMHAVITKYNMKSPVSGNDLSEPVAFNLMFATSIGPTGLIKGFLRPETAQGMFVNFKRLLEFNQGKLPFAAAQIGSSFRNEISPRSGLLRVREFEQAEVEHFCDPNDKSHPKFADVAHLQMTMYSACNQVSGQSPQNLVIGEAVKSGLVANETLGYFIAKIYKFLTKCGINPKKLRFRQHMSNEMAHYAQDCWDAECHTSYGWVELVGCADRSAFDLEQHAKHANVKLTAEKQLPKVKEVPVAKIVAEKSVIGKLFKKDAKLINDYLAGLTLEQVDEIEAKIKEGGQVELTVADKKFSVPAANLECKRYTELVHVEEFVPSVIEPSMGIGRILYTIWEHNFKERDAQRNYLAVPVVLAPYKCSLLPLSNNEEFRPMIKELSSMLTENGISYKLDDSAGSIGKRYARTDEISIPFGLTIDFESLKEPKSVTLRERDSMEQVRLNVDVLLSVLNGLISQKLTWKDVTSKYPLLAAKEE